MITLGSYSYDDYAAWDPAVMKIDFFSPHIYAWPQQYNGYDIATTLDVNDAHLQWMGRTCPMPWIVGETGFSAEDDGQDPLDFYTGTDNQHLTPDPTYHRMPWMMGSEAQQAEFAVRSMDATRNFLGSGYSWWGFQNVRAENLNSPYRDYRECWWAPWKFGNEAGLLLPGTSNPLPAPWNVENRWRPKDMVDDMATYTLPPAPSAMPPPVPNYGDWNTPVGDVERDGYVHDQDDEPVADALVSFVWRHLDIADEDPAQDNIMDWFRATTDANGYFRVHQQQQLVGYQAPGLELSFVDAIGATRQHDIAPSGEVTGLTRYLLPYVSTTSVLVTADMPPHEYKARFELEVEDGLVGWGTGGGTANLFARSSVHIQSEFHAEPGTEVHIFTEPVFPDCAAEGGPRMAERPHQAHSTLLTNSPSKRAVTLNFVRLIPVVQVVPNPATEEIHLNTDRAGFTYAILDGLGRSVLVGTSSGTSTQIDVSQLPAGPYQAAVHWADRQATTKFTINR